VGDRAYRKTVSRLFSAALSAVDPHHAVLSHLEIAAGVLTTPDRRYKLSKFDRIVILGAGKAGYPMTLACEEIFGSSISEGLVIVKDGHAGSTRWVKIVEGSHPLPSKRNELATSDLLALAETCDERTLTIVLVSGGGSALLPAPAQGLTLQDKQSTTKVLLDCGASITELNCVRKHLSRLKGGGLARTLYPAHSIVLILSDVIGNRLDSIASGPLAADETDFSEACAIIDRYGVSAALPRRVIEHLHSGAKGDRPETLSLGDPALERVHSLLIGSNELALTAVARTARSDGWTVEFLSSTFEGEARELARFYGALCRERASRRRRKPLLILGGGETTVTIRGKGKGGRNQEFALALAKEIARVPGAFGAGFASDGTDGPTTVAGAWADATTVERAECAGLDIDDHLQRNDSHAFFAAMDDHIVTGPTGTNVCDLYLAGIWC